MEVDLITRSEFDAFRQEMIETLKEYLTNQQKPDRLWIRSKEVRKMLNISYGTLQNLRISGKLKCTKLGGVIYYNVKDIEALLNAETEQ